MLCVLILYISGGTYSLKSTPNDRFFEKLFMTILFTLRVFARNLLRGNRWRNTFRISFWCLTWDSNPGFSSNKPTHYLLDHGDFVDCAKQFVRNAQNCGKSNHGFCIMITPQLTHRCLCVSFWPKTNIVFTGLGPCWLFPLPKTEDTDERKAFCYDWGDNRKNGDTKKRVSEVFQGLEKTLA